MKRYRRGSDRGVGVVLRSPGRPQEALREKLLRGMRRQARGADYHGIDDRISVGISQKCSGIVISRQFVLDEKTASAGKLCHNHFSFVVSGRSILLMWYQRRLAAYSAPKNRIGRRVQRPDVYECKTNREKVQRKHRACRPPPAAQIVFDPAAVIRVDQDPTSAAVRWMTLLVEENPMRGPVGCVEIHLLPMVNVGNFAMGSGRKHQSIVVKRSDGKT